MCTQTVITQEKSLWVHDGLGGDFCALGKYAMQSANLSEEVLKLCTNLPIEDQELVVRQVALSKEGWEKNDFWVYALTPQERLDHQAIDEQFFPNIFKISEELYFYKGYFLCGNYFGASTFWHKHNLKEVFSAQTLGRIRQKDIIDVGGFVGDSALIFEKEFCDKNIYSFEPVQENFLKLQKNLELNRSCRIIPVQKGLGAQKESLEIATFDSASSILYEVSSKKERIEITTLDEFVSENHLEVGFIKVDIEGFEREFLKGAKNTICTQKPALLISIYHSGKDYFEIKPLIESWNLGYTMRIHKGTDSVLHTETALYCSVEEK